MGQDDARRVRNFPLEFAITRNCPKMARFVFPCCMDMRFFGMAKSGGS